jgi:hypothetical protein
VGHARGLTPILPIYLLLFSNLVLYTTANIFISFLVVNMERVMTEGWAVMCAELAQEVINTYRRENKIGRGQDGGSYSESKMFQELR